MNDGFRETLSGYYEQKKLGNPAYSMNAFARDLGLYPSHLHDILRGRKGLSAATAKRIGFKLLADPEERRMFVDQVIASCSRGGQEKDRARRRLVAKRKLVDEELNADMFAIIKDWHHSAVREYVRVHGKRFKAETAARFLGLSVKTVRESTERLLRVGLLKKKPHLIATDPTFHAPVGVPSFAKKLHHLQLLEIARRAYLTQEFGRRDFMSSTLAIDSAKLPEAKKLIREFHANMNKLLCEKKSDDVFAFSTQLFSLERGGREILKKV
jgi:uncharacterized protein (TIGR02147 family)